MFAIIIKLKQLACKELQTWTYLDLHIKEMPVNIAACAVCTVAATSSVAVFSLIIGAFANNPSEYPVVVKEEERRCLGVKHKQGWEDIYVYNSERIKLVGLLVCFESTSQKNQRAFIFPF